jgi:hypothetical protein
MANVPSLRQQAVATGAQMPAVLQNAAIQAALAEPPLRPQRGPLQAPNWGNRPAVAPNAQGQPPNAGRGGAKKMKKTQKQKKRYSGKTRKH